jgi:hypothetical protein
MHLVTTQYSRTWELALKRQGDTRRISKTEHISASCLAVLESRYSTYYSIETIAQKYTVKNSRFNKMNKYSPRVKVKITFYLGQVKDYFHSTSQQKVAYIFKFCYQCNNILCAYPVSPVPACTFKITMYFFNKRINS